MRRPHVYERSAPRASRGPAPGAAEGRPRPPRTLLRLIESAIREAEAIGRADVAAALEGAREAAARTDPPDPDPLDPDPLDPT